MLSLSTTSALRIRSFALPLYASLRLVEQRLFSTSGALSAGYKLKTHQGAKKRWKAIASGVFKRGKAGHHHLNVSKTAGRKNRLGNTAYSNASQTAKLKKLLPWA